MTEAPPLYEVLKNEAAWRAETYPVVEGIHPWKLPSIKCPACGIVSGETAVVYPWIDLSGLPTRLVVKGDAVSALPPEELAEAVKPVRGLLGPDFPLPPGAFFGQFRGKHTAGTLEDFHLYFDYRLIARSAYERLRERGALSVGATPALIRGRKAAAVDHVELHLVPRARLAVPMIQRLGERYCAVCDFDQRSLPEPLVVAKESVPTHEEIFQLVDRPYVRLATPKFVDAVKSLGLTGIEFRPVEVA